MKEHEQEKVVSFQIKCTFLVIRLCWNSVCSKLSTWLGLTLPFEKQIYFMRNKHTHTQTVILFLTCAKHKGDDAIIDDTLTRILVVRSIFTGNTCMTKQCEAIFLFHFHSSAQKIAYILPTILLDWFAVANANIGDGTDTRCRCKTS